MDAKDFAPFERLLDDLRAEQPYEPGNVPNEHYLRPLGAVPVAGFPRAADDLSVLYTSAYRLDCKRAMRWFVDRVLADLPEGKHHLAHGITYQAAKTELQRPLRSPEHRLLSEATRDWIVAHEAKQAAEARR